MDVQLDEYVLSVLWVLQSTNDVLDLFFLSGNQPQSEQDRVLTMSRSPGATTGD